MFFSECECRMFHAQFAVSTHAKFLFGDKVSPRQFVDVRDSFGKWLPAEILSVKDHKLRIHYVNWDSKWDAWVDLNVAENLSRIAPFRSLSGSGNVTHTFHQSETVEIYMHPVGSIPATVLNIDRHQCQVECVRNSVKFQFWVSSQYGDIRHSVHNKITSLDSVDPLWLTQQSVDPLRSAPRKVIPHQTTNNDFWMGVNQHINDAKSAHTGVTPEQRFIDVHQSLKPSVTAKQSSTTLIDVSTAVTNSMPPFDEDWLCVVCRCLPLEPLGLSCGKILCKPCFNSFTKDEKKAFPCPACRQQMSTAPVSEFVAIKISGLTVYCQNETCTHKCLIGLKGATFIKHTIECPYRKIECFDCNKPINANNFASHRKNDCVKRIVMCPLCFDFMTFDALDSNHYNNVKLTDIKQPVLQCQGQRFCPNKCDEKAVILWRDIYSHKCPAVITCPICNVAFPKTEVIYHYNDTKQSKCTILELIKTIEILKTSTINNDDYGDKVDVPNVATDSDQNTSLRDETDDESTDNNSNVPRRERMRKMATGPRTMRTRARREVKRRGVKRFRFK